MSHTGPDLYEMDYNKRPAWEKKSFKKGTKKKASVPAMGPGEAPHNSNQKMKRRESGICAGAL